MIHYADTPNKKTEPVVIPVDILLSSYTIIKNYSSGGSAHLLYILTLKCLHYILPLSQGNFL